VPVIVTGSAAVSRMTGVILLRTGWTHVLCASFGHKGLIFQLGYGLADELLDVAKQGTLSGFAKRDSQTDCASPGGTTDAVDVGFRFVRDVVIHHESDAFDIDTTCRDIRGDQYARSLLLEIIERFLAGGLGFVTVNGFSPDAVAGQLIGQPAGTVLGAGEDQYESLFLTVQEVGEELVLVMVLDMADALFDFVSRCPGLRDGDIHRIFQQGMGEFADG